MVLVNVIDDLRKTAEGTEIANPLVLFKSMVTALLKITSWSGADELTQAVVTEWNGMKPYLGLP